MPPHLPTIICDYPVKFDRNLMRTCRASGASGTDVPMPTRLTYMAVWRQLRRRGRPSRILPSAVFSPLATVFRGFFRPNPAQSTRAGGSTLILREVEQLHMPGRDCRAVARPNTVIQGLEQNRRRVSNSDGGFSGGGSRSKCPSDPGKGLH